MDRVRENVMTPEEFQRLKEAEKDHLRKLKKLKDAARMLERQKKVSRAVTDMTSSMEQKLSEHADIMDQIAAAAALSEARLEIAMESSEKVDRVAQEMQDEETLSKERAKQLIRQMKAESGDEPEASTEKTRAESRKKTTTEDQTESLPEKTIGRMKP